MADTTGLYNYPAGIKEAVQKGILERVFRRGLESKLAYGRDAVMEPVPNGVGETVKKIRKSRKVPITAPLAPQTINSNINNGMTPTAFTTEQWELTVNNYADYSEVNLLQELAGVKKQSVEMADNNSVQAAQSLDLLARNAYADAYLGGNTYVRTALGAGSTTTCYVNDIRGFQKLLNSEGLLVSVSGSATLNVVETGGVNQTLVVTGVAAEGTNHSTVPGGISGVLTFQTATLPVDGDVLIAANAPAIFRPNGRKSTRQLTGNDIISMDQIDDIVAYLRDNGVPTFADGLYRCILDNTVERQLKNDERFLVAATGKMDAAELRQGRMYQYGGCLFIPTNQAIIQNPVAVGGVASDVAPKVRRTLIYGAESLVRGNFTGVKDWVAAVQGGIASIDVVDGVAFVTSGPIDVLKQKATLAWTYVGGFAVPTDLTASTDTIPTANGPALFKRAAWIESAG